MTGSTPTELGPRGATWGKTAALRVAIGCIIVGSFAGLWLWTVHATDTLRGELEANVALLGRARVLDRSLQCGGPQDPVGLQALAGGLEALAQATRQGSARAALAPAVAEVRRWQTAASRDPGVAIAALDSYVTLVRGHSGEISKDLAGQWTLMRLQALVSVLFAATTLLLFLHADRRSRTDGNLRRQLERTVEENRRAREQAEIANAVKARFLANLSHELRTPLTGIIGLVDLMRTSAMDPVQRQQLDTVARNGKSLLSIINDILDFSRIDAGRLRLDMGRVDVRGVVDEAMAGAAAAGQVKRLELVAWVDPGVPRTWPGDGVRIRQVLTNLIGNAVKFTDKGSVQVHVCKKLGCLQVEIRDTGPGIEQDNIAKLFVPFTQLDDLPTRRFGGAGLGLAISRELVVRMGGRIDVESELGLGTTFIVTLPPATTGPDDEPMPIPTLQWQSFRLAMPPGPTRDALQQAIAHWGAEVVSVPPHDIIGSRTSMTLVRLEDLENLPPNSLPDGYNVTAVAPLVRSDAAQVARSTGAQWLLLTPIRDDELRALVTGQGLQLTHARAGSETFELETTEPHVLVVEDDVVTAHVITLMLKRLGCSSEQVVDGQSAVDRARAGRFDAILMDCQLPVLDGIEATRRIRAEGKRNRERVAIIAVTASASEADIDAMREAGMDSYLAKPATLDQLGTVLRANGVRIARRGRSAVFPAGDGSQLALQAKA